MPRIVFDNSLNVLIDKGRATDGVAEFLERLERTACDTDDELAAALSEPGCPEKDAQVAQLSEKATELAYAMAAIEELAGLDRHEWSTRHAS